MSDFIALMRKDPDSDYSVDFPDFPGCVTAGSDLDEAKAMATEALELHVEGMIEDGLPIPAPSSLESVMASVANKEAVAFLVSVDVDSDKAERINVTIRRKLLARIDAAAAEAGLSRSAFLAAAALRHFDNHAD